MNSGSVEKIISRDIANTFELYSEIENFYIDEEMERLFYRDVDPNCYGSLRNECQRHEEHEFNPSARNRTDLPSDRSARDKSSDPSETEQNDYEIFICSECGLSFDYKPDFVGHIRSHIAKESSSCSECNECFAPNSHVIRCHKTTQGERMFHY